MKRLLVAYLLAATAATFHAARAMNYCSTGSIQTNTIIATAVPGNSDTIIDCLISPMVAVSYATDTSPASRTAPASARIVGSTFGEDARMIIVGKPAYSQEVEETTAAAITIQGNTFQQGAMLYINGVFSPDTTITVSGNSFSFGYPLTSLFPDPPGRTDYFSSAIYVHDLGLLSNAVLSINGNTIKGDHGATLGFVAVNAINFGNDVFLYGTNAGVLVQNNDIDILCNGTNSSGMAVGGRKQLYMYGANTKFLVDGNRIKASGSAAVFRHPDVVVVGSGVTSFSDNVISANTQGMAALENNFRPVIRLGQLNIGDHGVSTWVRNNTIDVTGPLASIGVEGDVACGEGCALYVTDNRVTAYGGNPSVQFGQLVELRGNGAMWVNGNILVRTDTDASDASVAFGKSLRLSDTSTASISGNTFNARAPTLMVELSPSAQAAFAKQPNAALYVCGNQFGGVTHETIDDVKAVTSPQIGDAATAEACPAATTAAPADGTTGASSATASEGEGGNATTADEGPAPGGPATDDDDLSTVTTTEAPRSSEASATSIAAALAASAAAAVAALML